MKFPIRHRLAQVRVAPWRRWIARAILAATFVGFVGGCLYALWSLGALLPVAIFVAACAVLAWAIAESEWA